MFLQQRYSALTEQFSYKLIHNNYNVIYKKESRYYSGSLLIYPNQHHVRTTIISKRMFAYLTNFNVVAKVILIGIMASKIKNSINYEKHYGAILKGRTLNIIND